MGAEHRNICRLYSLEKYIGSKEFQPSPTVDVEKVKGLFN